MTCTVTLCFGWDELTAALEARGALAWRPARQAYDLDVTLYVLSCDGQRQAVLAPLKRMFQASAWFEMLDSRSTRTKVYRVVLPVGVVRPKGYLCKKCRDGG